MIKKPEKTKLVCLIAFIIYILIVLKLTIFRSAALYSERKLNLTLFTGLIDVLRTAGIGEFLRLFLGNIGWFIPLGFLLPILLKSKRLVTIIVIGFLFSLFIETSQFVFRKGIAEPDDLILNTLGAAVGYLLFKFMITSRKKSS